MKTKPISQNEMDQEKVKTLSPKQVKEKVEADFSLNIWELALWKSCPTPTVRFWQSEGMPHQKLGRRTLYLPSEVEAWLKNNKERKDAA